MTLFTRNLGAVVLATAWLLSVPQGTLSQANAQAQSPSPGPSDRTTAIPDQKLDAAAAVLERIASLKKDYEEQMVAAPASDKKRIAAEAFSAFQKAVTDQGLSLDEYISILEVAQNDPEVGDKTYARIAFSCALIVIPPNSTLGGEHSDATDDVQQSENHVLVEIIG
jgi:Domain of unknown function (DUF4168)